MPPSQLLRVIQNLASLSVPDNAIQKFSPSLHAPNGIAPVPAGNVPIGVRSDAFHNDTLRPPAFVTSIRSPSNAA